MGGLVRYYQTARSVVLCPTGFLPVFLLQAWSLLHPECELIFQLQEEERTCLQHIAEQGNQSSQGSCFDIDSRLCVSSQFCLVLKLSPLLTVNPKVASPSGTQWSAGLVRPSGRPSAQDALRCCPSLGTTQVRRVR